MNDISRHLPFSQGDGGDETAVTGDWRPLTAETLDLVADLLEGLDANDWEKPSLCDGWRVRDVAGHLEWRLGSSVAHLARSSARAVFRERVSPFRLVDEMSRRAGRQAPEVLVASIRSLAAARAAGVGRKNISELTEAVVHGYDIAHALGRPLPVAPAATGAVAVARSLVAPGAVKAITSRRTLRAVDADWTVGRGPDVAARADEIVLFLFGRVPLRAG